MQAKRDRIEWIQLSVGVGCRASTIMNKVSPPDRLSWACRQLETRGNVSNLYSAGTTPAQYADRSHSYIPTL